MKIKRRIIARASTAIIGAGVLTAALSGVSTIPASASTQGFVTICDNGTYPIDGWYKQILLIKVEANWCDSIVIPSNITGEVNLNLWVDNAGKWIGAVEFPASEGVSIAADGTAAHPGFTVISP